MRSLERILPESASTQMAKKSLPPAVAVVNQTCLPRMTGVDQPRSWIGVFQVTLLVSLQCSGRPVAVEWPSAVGPRKSGQSVSANAEGAKQRQINSRAKWLRMSLLGIAIL